MSERHGRRTFHAILVRSHWVLATQVGWDPRTTLRFITGFPRYLRDLARFRAAYSGRTELMPCVHDWYAEGGTTANEYFWQDLLVARAVFNVRPERHVDVGSRVDGFVAHVASFRELEVFDIRPITASIPGVITRQADLMNPESSPSAYCDSLSCLHALEHFGLGRYGDPIDANGFRDGIANLARLLKPGGTLYLSVPVGVERVEFNANRVFDPRTIVAVAAAYDLAASSFRTISTGGFVQDVGFDADAIAAVASQRYVLGLFEFIRGGSAPAVSTPSSTGAVI